MSSLKKNILKDTINDLDAGYWEIKSNNCLWSPLFFHKLGYDSNAITQSLDFFLNNLLHAEDHSLFKDNYFGFVNNDLHFKQKIHILHKNGRYIEFLCKTNKKLPVNISNESKLIFFFEKKIITHEKVKPNHFYYKETAEMTSTGSWYVDFVKRKSYWDDETKRILEYPEDYIPSLKNSHKYYSEEDQSLAAELFMKCAMTGTPFNNEIKMLTANGRVFWAKAIGKAVYNDTKEIIGIRGVFQDIDDLKQKELKIQKTSEIIASQNSRLFNFAHIVSHNLRSHTSNLLLISDLLDATESLEEKLDLINSVKDVSDSLNKTIEHLNEIVTIQTDTDQTRVELDFKTILNQVIRSVGHILTTKKAAIRTDFSKAKTIRYIPAYLESILLNLITNAVKYKHLDRDPIINIKTYTEDSRTILEVSDNGRGINLDIYKEKIFGMYMTFHNNEDAVGIGLFIVKNQVESLNGEISVKSDIGQGTTFKIKF